MTICAQGVIAKGLASPYRPGRRDPAWQKLRRTTTADLLIGAWIPTSPALTAVKAVLVGERTADGRLLSRGAVGAGFSQIEQADLADLLRGCPVARSREGGGVSESGVGRPSTGRR
ncbi:hypothetical protein [Kitasatospora sp. NPDC094015]|uniref:hypothetical protein n=1 Tax=Kitasatospora sp. NPDC094015 TaxID=3155205 RepID=UPI00331BA26E